MQGERARTAKAAMHFEDVAKQEEGDDSSELRSQFPMTFGAMLLQTHFPPHAV